MTSLKKEWIWLIALIVISFFANSGVIEVNLMESRNLTTAREMLQKGNWLEPTMNGELRFEKPPLPTWLAATSMAVFGQDNRFFLRMPAGIAAALLIFFLFKLVKELTDDKKIPFWAAGTAATSFYVFFMARDICWDIFCHSFMLGAIWQLHRGLHNRLSNNLNFIYSAILMVLSFLSKGPVSFFALLLPYLIASLIAYGPAPFKQKLKPLSSMVIIVIVFSSIWPLYIYFIHPDYSVYVAQKESAAWISRNTKPFYHYWSFTAQSGIWIILATAALVFPYAAKRVNRFGNYRFMATWVWASVILLSLFPEKKERYLLPVLLPLAILTAYYLHYLIASFANNNHTRSDTIILRINSWISGLAALILPIAVFWMIRKNGFSPGVIITAVSFIGFWGIAYYLLKSGVKKNPESLWRGMTALVALTCLLVFYQIPQIVQKNPNFRPYYELRQKPELEQVPFFGNFSWDGKHLEMVWASGREIKQWDPIANPALPVNAPLVLISKAPADSILSPEILHNYTIENIGLFDANLQKRWGGSVLRNHVTLIKPKN